MGSTLAPDVQKLEADFTFPEKWNYYVLQNSPVQLFQIRVAMP
jgi:hypothetical protein